MNSTNVLVILCALFFSAHAASEGDDDKGGPCEIFVQDVNNLTLNCSRRHIDKIPTWPATLETQGKEDGHVRITLFNNSISNVTQLAPVPGNRIAISFKSNKIVEIEDDAFRNLDHMGSYKDGVYSDIDLETLNLGYNEIHSLDKYLGLSYLRQIDLSGNFFLNVPESLSLVGDSLQYLTFNNNPLDCQT
ncbi:unnamed protein product [Leptidea sinapis]|uniref:Uncharacterized protein n=1 Tax=Leptidea sinapis TaxID=189913 RepID=A0A5E4R455_9NEOP|nr:unnamed protein product [Leptidea sinapis]